MATIDSYSEANYSFADSLWASSWHSYGQSFVVGAEWMVLGSCKFYIKKTGSPTGNITAKIYAHSGTFGTSSIPTGSVLATSDAVDITSLTTDLALVEFTFSGAEAITLAASTYYIVVLSYSGGSGGNILVLGLDNAAPTAAGNASRTEDDAAWSAIAGLDVCFYVYGTVAPSNSASLSPSSSASPSNSPSLSPSSSESPSLSPSSSPSASASPSSSESASNSPSLSPSSSISPSESPSSSPSSSISPSVSPSISASSSISPSISPSVSPSSSNSPSISASISPSASVSPSESPSPSPVNDRQLTYKVYSETGTYLGVLDDIVSDIVITKELNGGDSEFRFLLSRKFDDFDEGVTIKFNNRIKVYLKDKYNVAGTTLIAYGYIASYSPFLKGKDEGIEVTCLSAVSKLSNDFYRSGDSASASELGVSLTSRRADQMMEDIIDHYRSIESNSLLSNDYTNSDTTTDNDGTPTSFDHRFFNMKHLDALREASKFLPKNKDGGYWFYWRIDTDGKLWVKNISTTADHSFIIGKHINEISGDKSMLDIVNRVYFWNEKGTVDPDYIKLVNDDTDSQDDHDIMSDYITDSKITNAIAASLVTSARLYDGKDPKVTIKISMTGDYDLASIKPGQTCTLLNAKNNPYAVGADNVLLIESIEYSVDSAVLSLSNGHVSFADLVEEERQRLDKEMTWYGFITQQLTAAQLSPADRTWVTTINFTAETGANAYRQVNWSAGKVYIPAGASGESAIREVAAGNSGLMAGVTPYIVYLDEEDKPTASASETGTAGTILKGDNALLDASKAWTVDEWVGYVVAVNGEKQIVKSNTATILTTEENFVSDFTGAYSIAKLAFSITSTQSVAASVSRVVFSNIRANTLTTSEAIIVPVGASPDINIDGTQIAKKSISADNIIANTITANEISAAYIYAGLIDADQINVGVLTGFTVQTASSGFRLKMNGADNSYEFLYDNFVYAELKSEAIAETGHGGASLRGNAGVALLLSEEGEGVGDNSIGLYIGTDYFRAMYDAALDVFTETNIPMIFQSGSKLRIPVGTDLY